MYRTYRRVIANSVLLLACRTPLFAQQPAGTPEIHVWEMKEITLTAAQAYSSPYKEVTAWVDLRGPGFSKRVYAFWDGGELFKVRVVATEPGEWSWTSGSNQAGDEGLNQIRRVPVRLPARSREA